MKYQVKPTSQFRRDYKLAIRRGRDTQPLDDVIRCLANGQPLDAALKDHALSGIYKGNRECHIAPDWLLVYRIDEDVLVLTLTRTGTHSDLF